MVVILLWHTDWKRERQRASKRLKKRATGGSDREREGVRDREWREDEREKQKERGQEGETHDSQIHVSMCLGKKKETPSSVSEINKNRGMREQSERE